MGLQKEKPNNLSYAFLLCSITSLFYLYEFFLRVSPSVITNELMQAWHVSAIGLGTIASLFFWAYAPMQVPAGLLIDRYGPRRLLTVMVLFCTLGTFLFAMSQGVFLAGIGRFMIGMGSAFAFIGALVVIARWFPPHYFAMLAGGAQLLGSVGAIFGQAPLAYSVNAIGWRSTMFVAAIIGLLISILMWMFIRDYPLQDKEKHHAQLSAGGWQGEWQRLLKVLKKSQTWVIGTYAFAIWAPISVFATLWGVSYLAMLYQISNATASWMLSAIWIGIAIGSPLVGWYSDFTHCRNKPLLFCALIGLVSTLVIVYFPPESRWLMISMLFIFGFAAGGQALSFGVVKDIQEPKIVGTAIGFNNMSVVLGGFFFQPLVGVFLHFHATGDLVNSVPVYTVGDYRFSFVILPLCYLLASLVIYFKLKETHCRAC